MYFELYSKCYSNEMWNDKGNITLLSTFHDGMMSTVSKGGITKLIPEILSY